MPDDDRISLKNAMEVTFIEKSDSKAQQRSTSITRQLTQIKS